MFDFALLDHFAFPAFVLEIDDACVPHYVACNAQTCKQSDRSLIDYLGRTAKDVFAGTQGQVSYDRQCEAARSGKKVIYSLELPAEGTTQTLKTTLSPVKNPFGQVQWLFGSTQDVTAQQNASVAQESLRHLMDEMAQFVAVAAHDLRAPLRSVSHLADMLRAGLPKQDDQNRALVNLLEELAETSLMLITDVLKSAQSTNLPETQSKVELHTLCATLHAVLDLSAKHIINAPKAVLQTDSSLLQIALRNIIENALKHAGRSQVVINVRVKPATPGMVKITICDNGSGFSPSALAFLDGGNFQTSSGYGLFGIKRLINGRGGWLRAYNRPDGSGASVEIVLPGILSESDLEPGPHNMALLIPQRRAPQLQSQA